MYKKLLVIPEHDEKIIDKLNEELLLEERQKESIYQWAVKALTGLHGLPRKDAVYRKYSRH